MANLNDLRNYYRKDDFTDGDYITFKDAGEIVERDFSKAKDGSNVKKVFEISVEYNDKTKPLLLNASSRDALASVYGTQTDQWVGKQGKVRLVEQFAFGKTMEIMIVQPVMEET